MMPDPMRARLKNFVVTDEDYRNFPYLDDLGNVTIGIGYNLTARGLPNEWINTQFNADVDFFHSALLHDYPWYAILDENRQMALINMCFMGYKKFQGFVDLIAALAVQNWALAASEVLRSKWALQVKGRATRVAHIILTGDM